MVVMEALKPVFINGRIVEVGSKFSCSNEYAKKLVEGKSARLLTEDKTVNDDLINKLESMEKDDLLKLAEEKGIEGLSKRTKNDDIIEAILKVVD